MIEGDILGEDDDDVLDGGRAVVGVGPSGATGRGVSVSPVPQPLRSRVDDKPNARTFRMCVIMSSSERKLLVLGSATIDTRDT